MSEDKRIRRAHWDEVPARCRFFGGPLHDRLYCGPLDAEYYRHFEPAERIDARTWGKEGPPVFERYMVLIYKRMRFGGLSSGEYWDSWLYQGVQQED